MLPCIILCQRWRLVCYVCFADVRMLLSMLPLTPGYKISCEGQFHKDNQTGL